MRRFYHGLDPHELTYDGLITAIENISVISKWENGESPVTKDEPKTKSPQEWIEWAKANPQLAMQKASEPVLRTQEEKKELFNKLTGAEDKVSIISSGFKIIKEEVT